MQKKNALNIALYLFSFFGLQVLAAVVMGLVRYITLGTPISMNTLLVGTMLFADVVTIGLFLALRWCNASMEWLRKKPFLVMTWCVILAMALIVPSSAAEEMLPEAFQTDLMGDSWKALSSSPFGYLLLCILTPLVEEMVFRGAIQRQAMKIFQHPWYAIILSSVIFSLAHLNPAQIPHAFIIGLLMGWLCYRTGSIIPGIIVHWVNNSMAYCILTYVHGGDQLKTIDLFGGEQWRLYTAIAISLVLIIIALRQLYLSFRNDKELS